MIIGGKYNFKNQSERLIYLGNNWSGNGCWHQFSKVDDPEVVWAEMLEQDLSMIEETKQHHNRSYKRLAFASQGET